MGRSSRWRLRSPRVHRESPARSSTVATGVGLVVRVLLVQLLPGNDLTMILTRATVLCVVGMSIYVALARLFGIGELAEIVGKLRRTIRVRQLT
jgi:putative peptidoglycan lipid II flippase